jgi:hypothetical protein
MRDRGSPRFYAIPGLRSPLSLNARRERKLPRFSMPESSSIVAVRLLWVPPGLPTAPCVLGDPLADLLYNAEPVRRLAAIGAVVPVPGSDFAGDTSGGARCKDGHLTL